MASPRSLTYSIQYHADQRLDQCAITGPMFSGIDGLAIALQRKSNSGELNGRHWRSAYGVLTVRVATPT